MRFVGMKPWGRLGADLREFVLNTGEFEYDPHNFGTPLSAAWRVGVDRAGSTLSLEIRMSERRLEASGDTETCDDVLRVEFSDVKDLKIHQRAPDDDLLAIDYYLEDYEDAGDRAAIVDFYFGDLSLHYSFSSVNLVVVPA